MQAIQNIVDEFIEKWITPMIEVSIHKKGVREYFSAGKIIPWGYYDIASLTKNILSTILLIDISNWEIDENDDIGKYVVYLQGHNKTIKNVLTHTSWFDIIEKYDKSKTYTKAEIESIIKNPKNIITTQNHTYSNLNYVYMWDLLEMRYKKPLQEIVEEFLKKNGINNILYTPLKIWIPEEKIYRTENNRTQWIVHDPVTYYLWGISGAAWLFATHEDLEKFFYQRYTNTYEIEQKLWEEEIKAEEKWKEIYGMIWRKGRYGDDFVEFSWHTGPRVALSRKLDCIIIWTCNIVHGISAIERRMAYMEQKKILLEAVMK
jgi:CubicO group peptidase (beta-lactamase class C family)